MPTAHSRGAWIREVVAGIKVQHFTSLVPFQGVRVFQRSELQLLLDPSALVFGAQRELDKDANFKQIVTYAVLTFDGNVLSFKRPSSSNVPTLLRGKLSIGFGGHVARQDVVRGLEIFDGVMHSLRREIGEETGLVLSASALQSGPVSILNDDSLFLCRTHFGLIVRIDLKRAERGRILKEQKSEIHQLKWIPFRELAKRSDELELWSRLVLETLDERFGG